MPPRQGVAYALERCAGPVGPRLMQTLPRFFAISFRAAQGGPFGTRVLPRLEDWRHTALFFGQTRTNDRPEPVSKDPILRALCNQESPFFSRTAVKNARSGNYALVITRIYG